MRAQLQADHPIDLVAAGDEKQHRHLAAARQRLQPLEQLEAIEVRQADVQDCQRWRLRGKLTQRIFAGGAANRREAVGGQHVLQRVGDARLVFDHEDA